MKILVWMSDVLITMMVSLLLDLVSGQSKDSVWIYTYIHNRGGEFTLIYCNTHTHTHTHTNVFSHADTYSTSQG
jgi:hypothetical protein